MLRRTFCAVLALACIPVVPSQADCNSEDCKAGIVDIRLANEAVTRRETHAAFFSFNLNHYRFERDLFDASEADYAAVRAYLGAFAGNYLRYPGGLLSNTFDWEGSTGPDATRRPQASGQERTPEVVNFGPDEYFDLLQSTGSMPWYVLNLSGWDKKRSPVELPIEQVADSNSNLVRHLQERFPGKPLQFLQLGNELDRSIYQWPTAKYVERSRAVMDAVGSVDRDIRFVAFLRDFDWKYKGKSDPRAGTKSKHEDFITDTLQGLPDVSDYSLHFYYDDPGLDRRHKAIGIRLKQMQKAIAVANAARPGEDLNVWITEHARGVNLQQGRGMQRADLTSNHDAAVSTADFLIGIAAIPEIKGAFWHGVNAGPWQLFDATIEYKDLRPRPVYWGLRTLHAVQLPVVLQTSLKQKSQSGYAGGYDVSAVGFRNDDSNEYGVWISNRRNERTRTRITIDKLSGKSVSIEQFQLSPDSAAPATSGSLPGVLVPEQTRATADASGTIEIWLAPRSVSAVGIRDATAEDID
jgi:hypothetical protein